MAVSNNVYELTYIVNGVLGENQIKEVVNRINRYISEHGGNIVETDEWGTRRLSYPIRKKRNGYYVNLYFESDGEMIQRMERSLEIDDDILRYLTLRLDAKMLRHYEAQRATGKRARAQDVETAGRQNEDEDDD